MFDNATGRTLWEMMSGDMKNDQNIVQKTVTRIGEAIKSDFFNPLELCVGDIARVSVGDDRKRFQVVEVDVFDRGNAGKTADYRFYRKAGENQTECERYLRVFPRNTPDGKLSFDLLLLENVASVGYDQTVADLLGRNEFPLDGYEGFTRNNGVTLPYEVTVTEIKREERTSRKLKYWDFVRPANESYEAFFVEMDSETGAFDAYFAKPVPTEAVEFLRRK